MTLHYSTLKTNGRIRKESVSIAIAITLMLLAILPGMPLIGAAVSDQHAVLLPLRFLVTLPLPGRSQSEAELAKGKFLVASRHLRDPNFSETVILLIDYDWHGAMGLVINRPTEVKLSTVLPGIEGLQQRRDTVYIGGPVARSQMLLLIRSGSQPEGSRRVFADIYVSSSRTVLQQMIDNANAGERFRVYAGYAGWAPGQLDQEVSRGDWHVLPADAETVFDKAPSEIWPELILRSSVEWARVQEPGRNVVFGRRGRSSVKSTGLMINADFRYEVVANTTANCSMLNGHGVYQPC